MKTGDVKMCVCVYIYVYILGYVCMIGLCVCVCAQAISPPQLVTGTLQSYFPTCLFPDGTDESSGLLFKNDGWRMEERER